MNSKELLEQAKEKAEKQLKLVDEVEDSERIIGKVKGGFICFYTIEHGSVRIDSVADPEKMDVIKDMTLVAIMNYRDERIAELEKLLGIRKPATINPEFEKAVQEMEKSHKEPKSDSLWDKPAEILGDEAKKIEAPEKSQDKYPAPKQNKRVKTPENMNEADVRRMYVEENRDRKYIASHYGISESKVNNYLFLHDIKRKATKASKPAEPEETERP